MPILHFDNLQVLSAAIKKKVKRDRWSAQDALSKKFKNGTLFEDPQILKYFMKCLLAL